MKVRIVKGKRKNVASYGKYVAKAVHFQTITPEAFGKEIQENCTAKCSDVELVLREAFDVLDFHMRRGDKVQLPHIGTLKLEVDSRVFDKAEDFVPGKHIKRVKLSLIPNSSHGKQELYSNVDIEKMD